MTDPRYAVEDENPDTVTPDDGLGVPEPDPVLPTDDTDDDGDTADSDDGTDIHEEDTAP